MLASSKATASLSEVAPIELGFCVGTKFGAEISAKDLLGFEEDPPQISTPAFTHLDQKSCDTQVGSRPKQLHLSVKVTYEGADLLLENFEKELCGIGLEGLWILKKLVAKLARK